MISGSQSPPRRYFYPRPPGGGRLPSLPIRSLSAIFLSTPSGWRATARLYRGILISRISIHALRVEGDYDLFYICNTFFISIHALRVEGDAVLDRNNYVFFVFLSTPSGWRATSTTMLGSACRLNFYPRPPGGGRRLLLFTIISFFYFYPRPPGGGRRERSTQSHAVRTISIHALRVEGDLAEATLICHGADFYPRPPGGGRLLVALFGRASA